MKRGDAHVLAVPVPAQGHVTPLMNLSRLIASHGIKVTFVNTEFIHNKIPPHQHHAAAASNLVLTSIPDGLGVDVDRNDPFKLIETLKATMAGHLTDLVEKINGDDEKKISCIIADITLAWVLEIAGSLGAEPVGFAPASAASLAVILHIPNLIQQGNLDFYGTMKGSEIIRLSDDIPPWRRDELAWCFPNHLETQKLILECCLYGEKSAKSHSNWLLCNTFYELESSACDLNPKLLPVGPLLKSSSTESVASSSSFYAEDTSCLRWLDQKACGSVMYVSFGSVAVCSQRQLDELALGLELSGRPFLWAVRLNLTNDGSRVEYPNGFLERVSDGGLGKIV